MQIEPRITQELGIERWQTDAVISLIDEGNTIPFIARYRKERTGALNDEVLRNFEERLNYLRNLEERREVIIESIKEQDKMTDELEKKLRAAETAVKLEDLYRPYKPKRRTRAMIAEEKGLSGLSDYILSKEASTPVLKEAEKYISEEKEVGSAEEAVQLAKDIIAGRLSDDAGNREWIRQVTINKGSLMTKARDKEESSVYDTYYDFDEAVKRIPGYRVLAINRGEKENFLKVSIEAPRESIVGYLEKSISTGNPLTKDIIRESAEDAYNRLIAPSTETEIRNMLTESAEEGALKVFGKNLSQLLMQPPVKGQTVLGWDPAFRTGCKLAVVDHTGKLLDTTVIFPTAPQNKISEAERVLKKLIDKYDIDLISIGNGTASRESEKIVADFIKNNKYEKLKYVIVSEAGASVYSASKLADLEMPNRDVGERSSASIARRIQDPLSELVKIDPKAIGVGQYQHDINQKRLGETLSNVVDDCVNRTGVDVNTASAVLLEHIAGVSKSVASNIVNYREEKGEFNDRRELLKVPRLGPKAYKQCAGFLRITDGKNIMDSTAVHPESYKEAEKLLSALEYSKDDVVNGKTSDIKRRIGVKDIKETDSTLLSLSEKTGMGIYTLMDVITELEKPGRDPRESVQGPVLRNDVLDMDDLRPGMELKGTVRNIVDFGAFVDIGVHEDGLVHISQLADRFVKHPLDIVNVGDIVKVRVLSVDKKKHRIALTMKKQIDDIEQL